MSSTTPAPAASPPTGPYLAAAVLCEKVLHEQDGVISLIRVVDRVIQTAVGPEAPDDMPPMPVNLQAVIVVKSGDARGRYPIRLSVESPSGLDTGQEAVLHVLLEGEDRGVNVVANFGFIATQEGLYWIDVRFGEQDLLLTRIPLRVVYQAQRMSTGTDSQAE